MSNWLKSCFIFGVSQFLLKFAGYCNGQLEGNDVDKLFKEDNSQKVLMCVRDDADQKVNFMVILQNLRYFISVISSLEPKVYRFIQFRTSNQLIYVQKHFNMEDFRKKSENFQIFLIEKTKFIQPPEYLHIVLG